MRSVFTMLGMALLILSIAMLVPLLISILYHEGNTIFFVSTLVTLFASISFLILGKPRKLSSTQVIVVTSLSWIISTIFSALPFHLSGLSYTDAFFEAMSGITTTGSTIFTSVEAQEKSILMWRAILHGIGGLGIIVSSIAILPTFRRTDNMQLFHAESSEGDRLGNTKKMSLLIFYVYLVLITMCCVMYFAAGMNIFDAVCHSISTVGTGGFANYDNSFTHYHNYTIDWIAIIFMILGAVPFVLFIKLTHGKFDFFRDEQIKWLILLILIFSVPVMFDAALTEHLDNSLLSNIMLALFNTTSIITSTGFIKENYNIWGVGSANMALFCLAFFGGCSGSTAGGIKIFRMIILTKHSFHNIKHILSPHKIEVIRVSGKQLLPHTLSQAYSFFFIFIMLYLMFSVLLAMSGVDFATSLSSAAAAITNSGPGIGTTIGPYGNYSSLSDISKWLLSFLMIIGRLEVFTVMAFIALLLRKR